MFVDKNTKEALVYTNRQKKEKTPRVLALGVEIAEASKNLREGKPLEFIAPLRVGGKNSDIGKDGKPTPEVYREYEAIGPACSAAGFSRRSVDRNKNWNYVRLTGPVFGTYKEKPVFVFSLRFDGQKTAVSRLETASAKPKAKRTSRRAKEQTDAPKPTDAPVESPSEPIS